MAGSPGGAVTFLFTDIEGSTALWERYPETMGPALSRHDGILRTTITHHRGWVFKTVGDGFHAVFDRARDAFDAALAIQDAIAAANWDDVGSLRVRIALHTGAAEPRDGDFYGQTVNRVARILDGMAGGEILASEETIHLVGDGLPPSVSLRSLGEMSLRGVPQPLQVYRLERGREGSGDATDVVGRSAAPSGSTSEDDDPLGLRVFALGDFRVERGGEAIRMEAWTAGAGRQLFKCLISRRLRRMTSGEAQELFLPKSADAGGQTLRTMVGRFRRFLEPGVNYRQTVIVAEGGIVAIRRDADLWIDADEFERLVMDARRAERPEALLEEADRLYQGDYLPDDLAEDWAGPRRRELYDLWTELQLALARVRERRGDVEGAATALNKVLAKDACDERAARELMLLWGRHGRRSDAHRVYVQLVEALRRELDGATPSPETREVHRQVIEGDAPASSPATPHSAPAESAPGGTVAERPAAAAAPPARPGVDRPVDRSRSTAAGATPPTEPPEATHRPGPIEDEAFEPSYPFPVPDLLVGRQRELLDGRRALERGRIAGRTVLIGATAGTGKSTLAGTLVEQARSMGYLCLVGGSFDQESPIPFGPIRDALADYLLVQAPDRLRSELGAITADLEPIVPELRYHVPGLGQRSSESPDAGRLLAAVYGLLRALAAGQPVLLCLEDLHAADGATLQALHHLARRIVREPIVLIGTFRSEEALQDRPLARLLASMTRERLVEEIRLGALDRNETALLISSLLGGPVSESLTEALFTVTEGNPLFVEQLVLSLREEGEIVQRDATWHPVAIERASIPPIVRDVIERRFGSLEPACRETLEVAAVFGQTFELQPLVAVLGTADEARVINDIDAAVDAHLVRETTGGYRFGHAMVCEALYRGLRGRRRAQLHARVGEAVEEIAGASFVERAAELAHHFRRAGDEPERRRKALTYSLVAGRRAADLSSFREAREHFVHACELTHRPDLDVDDATRIEALEGRAWAERQLGMWTSCIATCRAILGMSSVPLTRARARSMTCRALNMLGSTHDALREAEAGLVELGQGEGGDVDDETARTRIQLLYDQAFLGYLFGRFRRVETLGLEMLGIAERHGWLESYFLPHSTIALALMHQGRDAEAVDRYGLGIAAAERAGDRLNLAVIHENLGRHHYLAGRFEAAMPELGRAVELYRATVSDIRSVNALRLIGLVMLAGGHVSGASEHAHRALTVALEGHDRWEAECRDLLGAIQIVTASWQDAAASYRRALEIRERVSHADGMVESLVGLASVDELRGAWDSAEQHAQRALDVAREMDPCPDQARPPRLLGRILLRRGDADAAARYLAEAIEVCERVLPTLEAAPTLLALAELRQRAGDPSARALLTRALELGGAADVMIEAHVMAAELAGQAGDLDGARRHVQRARDLSERMPAPRLRGLIHLAAARLGVHLGDVPSATAAFEEARLSLEEAQTPYDLAIVLREYGRLLIADGKASEGGAMLDAARASFERLGARDDAARCD